MNRYGVTSSIAPLRRVLVRTPATTGDFLGAGWRLPDPAVLLDEHEHFVQLLLDLGCEVICEPSLADQVDSVFVYDSAFVIGAGGLALQSAKPARSGESGPAEQALVAAGLPIIGRLDGAAKCDGGDLLWLEDGTLIAGRTYRTNEAAHRQLADILAAQGHGYLRADMPHDKGPDVCLHLMSVVSPVDNGLAVVFEPLAPVPLLEALNERDVRWISVDADEYEAMGTNILAVRPGVVIMLDGLPRTQAALEANGVEVHTYRGSHLSRRGDGGPTCLTRPLWRAA